MAPSCAEGPGPRRWKTRLRSAASIPEAVALAGLFLAACDASEVGILSRAGAPRAFATVGDVKEAVLCVGVARAFAPAAGGPSPRLKRVFGFLTAAATRIGQLELEAVQARPRRGTPDRQA